MPFDPVVAEDFRLEHFLNVLASIVLEVFGVFENVQSYM